MTLQQAAWQKRADIEALEADRPYHSANVLGPSTPIRDKSDDPVKTPIWVWFALVIIVAIFILF